MYDGCILPLPYYACIYTFSYLSLVSFAYAVYRNYIFLCIVPGSVFLSSILYWQRPDYSWRRYVDMIVVQLGLWYQCYIAWYSEMGILYYITVVLCCISFLLGVHYYQKRNLLMSTIFHLLVHSIGNIGNVILYSGQIYN